MTRYTDDFDSFSCGLQHVNAYSAIPVCTIHKWALPCLRPSEVLLEDLCLNGIDVCLIPPAVCRLSALGQFHLSDAFILLFTPELHLSARAFAPYPVRLVE